MKKVLLLGLMLVGVSVFAQELPANPETGKCYVRCKTPDQWENQDVTIEVSPAYKKMKVVPAQYGTEMQTVVVQDAYKVLKVVPAVYGTETFTVEVNGPAQSLKRIPANTTYSTVDVVVQSAGQKLEVVPAVYETRTETIVIQPATTRVKMIPAVYETRTETIVTQAAGQTMSATPAKWGTEKLTYRKSDFGSKLSIVKAKFSSSSETIETKAESAKWTMSDKAPDCLSSDPNDCRYWCYKAIPAQFTIVNTTVLVSDAMVNRVPGCNQEGGSNADCGNSTYSKKILVSPATTSVKDVPAITKTVKRVVMVTPPTTQTIDVPAVTKTVKKVVMVTPPTTRVIEIPAIIKSFKVTNISAETTEVVAIPAVDKTFKRTIMTTPPQAQASDIATKTVNLKRTVLAKDAYVTEETVAAQFKTVTKEVLVNKGGLDSWKEVECELVEYSPLPIIWNLGSATLTSTAKGLIDSRLMPVLKQGVAIEIASHTDSRGSVSSNQDLSERRAQAVVNYLMAKGVNASKLVAKGYGENRLTNRCADGVTCTEREHQANRRTEFRVINEK